MFHGRQGAAQARVLQPDPERASPIRRSAVELSIIARDGSGDAVLFTVADNGPGIPPEYHEVIFRKFEQRRKTALTFRACAAPGSASRSASWWSTRTAARSGCRARKGEGSAFHVQLPDRVRSRRQRAARVSAWSGRGVVGRSMKVYCAPSDAARTSTTPKQCARCSQRPAAKIVATPAEADVAVFNSCAVTAAAEADSGRSVRRAARRIRPVLRTIVMGCAAASGRDETRLRSRRCRRSMRVVPGADLARDRRGARTAAVIRARRDVQTGTRALLRIQDGCDEHCTFCATTLARGANRSRRDVGRSSTRRAALAERHPEIVLTGIHIGTYGRDIGDSLRRAGRAAGRASVPRVRFRLTSVEATEVDDGSRELLSANRRVLRRICTRRCSRARTACSKRMGRHWYTACVVRGGRRATRRATAASSRSAADVIAGFPGETEDDHRATLRAGRVAAVHVRCTSFRIRLAPGNGRERLGEPGRRRGRASAGRGAARARASEKPRTHAARAGRRPRATSS